MMFSKTFRLLLDEGEQLDLHVLYDLEPYLDEIELVHKALKLGIIELKRAAEKKREDPDFVSRTQREARASSAAPPWREHVSRSPREVENYIGLPVSEALRGELQEFLDAHPELMSEEEAFAMLLHLGLRYAEHVPSWRRAGSQDARARRLARRCRLLSLMKC